MCIIPLLLILLLCYVIFLLIGSVSLIACLVLCLLACLLFAIVMLVTLSICVIYWLFVCVVLVLSICCLFRPCWLVSILPCNYTINTYIPLYFACIGLLSYRLNTLPPCHYYRFIWLVFVFICVAGIIYDKALLKGAYLLALLIFRVGIIIYILSFPCLHIHKKRKITILVISLDCI